MNGNIILASTSPYRRALLERLGIPFRCEAPRVCEDDLKASALAPRALAEQLALAKAQSVAATAPEATIIGSDQLVAIGNEIFGKPLTAPRAIEQLWALAGTGHTLITAMVVLHGGKVHSHTDVTTLYMRALERAEIERYVEADQPFDCAGAYKLESRGIALFERIESADHTAIIGLPLMALVSILRALGYRIP